MILFSCNKDLLIQENENINFVSAVDISSYPEISNTNPNFYDVNGKAYFGEMTFTMGFGSLYNEFYENLGDKLDLSYIFPEKFKNK